MPPKSTSAARPPRRATRATARKSVSNSNSTTPLDTRPPSSTVAGPTSTASATDFVRHPSTAIPTSTEPSQETRYSHTSDTVNTLPESPHASIPFSHTQSQISQKTLATNTVPVKSDSDGINCNKNEESVKSFKPENTGVENFGPGKAIHMEAETVVETEDGSKNTVNLSSVPVWRQHVPDDCSVTPLTGSENGAGGVARPGKRKIVKKVVRVVKKVIKKRVPKRILTNGSENQGSMEEKQDGLNLSEVTENLDLENDLIEKANTEDEVSERACVVNEAKGIPNMADSVIENLDSVDNASEKSNEAIEKASIKDEATRKSNPVNSNSVLQPINGQKGNDLSGTDSMEIKTSNIQFGSSTSEEMMCTRADDPNGIHTTDNFKSNDVENSMEVRKVNYAAEIAMETKETANYMMENQSKDSAAETANSVMENQTKDSAAESPSIDIIDKDVGLSADQDVGPVGEKSVALVAEKGKSMVDKAKRGNCELENDSIKWNEGLLLSGEMEALERKKRRKTEIFVGGLDKDTKEEDIRKVFEEVGVIAEVRLLMNGKTGKNKGFAFVRFTTAADAKKALEIYSKVEICGKHCGAAPVESNDTIFLGNIDKNWKTDDLLMLLKIAGIGKIDKVTLKVDPKNIEKNRGFAFVEFETSKDAQIALNKLQKKDAFGKNLTVKVAWAQPLIEPDEEEVLKVKSVYAEYLPSSWDEEKVKEYFKRFGEIENVVLAKDLPSSRRQDFAFINYKTRDAAVTCVEVISRESLEDDSSKVKMAVSLAKPVQKSKQMKHTSDLTSKKLSKAKQKASQTSKKLHEPRYKVKPASGSYHIKDDNMTSTTDELVQLLRQQASSHHILPNRTGLNVPDHHYLAPGNKRPFSLLAHDPFHMDPHVMPRVRMESSYPFYGPSSSSHGVSWPSFSYHQDRPDFACESVSGRRVYPNNFETREQAPYYGGNTLYRRY